MYYKLTEEKIEINGIVLFRIEATEDLPLHGVKTGDMGGFIQKTNNLSGNAWVYGNACVYSDAEVYGNAKVCGDAKVCGNAEVYGDAKVSGNACVYGNAKVSGNACVYGNADVYGNAKVSGNACVYCHAEVYGNAEVCGDAKVCGNAEVCGDAKVCGNADYIVFKNWWSSGRYFTWTRSNNMWRVCCFYGIGEELIKKAYADSKKSGKEYERIVKYVNEIINQ